MSHDPLAELDASVASAADEVTAEPRVLSLVPSLTIVDVGEFYEACHAALHTTGPLLIDGSAVEVIDGAGLQLISCCVKDAIDNGKEVQWQQVSEALARSSAIMGLSSALAIE